MLELRAWRRDIAAVNRAHGRSPGARRFYLRKVAGPLAVTGDFLRHHFPGVEPRDLGLKRARY
jgi:hypothetical protein